MGRKTCGEVWKIWILPRQAVEVKDRLVQSFLTSLLSRYSGILKTRCELAATTKIIWPTKKSTLKPRLLSWAAMHLQLNDKREVKMVELMEMEG